MFILILMLCAVTSAYRPFFIYILRPQAVERSLSLKFCSARWMAASREFIFVICIILLSLRVRDLRKT